MTKPILVTGGTGKTGRRTVDQLRERGHAPRVGTRKPIAAADVRFDWRDASTFDAAFTGVRAVYLVAPTDDFDSIGVMQPGLEAALQAGVQRFVLLSASSLEHDGPMMGKVHAWLHKHAPEWAVLRPSWFMQNFSEGQHLAPIRDESSIYTATEDGRAGFIDADDIAACATALLTAPQIENADHIITGPEAVSYDSLASTLSSQLGRTVKHARLSTASLAGRYETLGLPADYAATLASMDASIAGGSENRISNNVEKITGKTPNSFAQFAQRNVAVWQPGC